MRVAVMGTGGLGGMLGALQARAGFDVTFVARGQNLHALREHGLTVQLPGDEFHLRVQATDDPSQIEPVDLVWFCVKTYDVEAAARQIAPMLKPEAMVLPVQNGVEAWDQVAAVVGQRHVLGAVNLGGATLVSPGVVAAKGLRRQVSLGELAGGASTRTEELRRILSETGIDVLVNPSIRSEIWDKFVVACVTLGLGALMRSTLEPIVSNPTSTSFALGIMAEAVSVAAAMEVDLPGGTPERWLKYVRERAAATPGLAGSMYYDIVAGKRLEVEAINGAVVRLGGRHGISTPLNYAVYAGLAPFIDGAPATLT